MSYALENLEISINKYLKTENTTQDLAQIQTILQEIHSEKEEIKKHITTQVFSIKKEKRIELFIQQYKCALIRLVNAVFNFKNTALPALAALAEIYLLVITDLLFFIENHFTRYFNLNEKIPNSYKYIMQTKCKQ